MSQRIFQVLIPLCLLAILACGSPRIYPSDHQIRDRRHDCASCRRERPEALVSWYTQPARREYTVLEPEIPRWPSNRPFQPEPSFSPPPHNFYGAAPRSRGSPVTITSQRGIAKSPVTYTREEPINFQQRSLSFDMAAAPAAPVRGFGAPSALFQTRPPVNKAVRLGSSPYQSSSFYDVIKRESVPEANVRYTGFDPSGDEPFIEDVHGSLRAYEDPKKVSAVYRADKYPDDFLEQGNPIVPAEEYFKRQAPEQYPVRLAPEQYPVRLAPEHYSIKQAPEHYSIKQAPEPYPKPQAPAQYSRRQAPGQYFRRQAPEGRIPAGRQAPENRIPAGRQAPENRIPAGRQVVEVQQPRREEYLDSQVVHVPEIKRDSYRRVPERNIMKIMQNVGEEEFTITNGSTWQDQTGQELEGSPRNAAKTEGQKQTVDVNVLNDGDQSGEEEDRSQKLEDAVEGYGNVERSKKSTILTSSTEAKPILEISTDDQ